ncbi:MAG TPA: hypothetical protein VMT30_04060 [Candidatus Saccharimonadia bacterium]|nr:hypothetical protein [Candidatus Saccharimonadia bacterium]
MKILRNVKLFGSLTISLLIIGLLPFPWEIGLAIDLLTAATVILTLISGIINLVPAVRAHKYQKTHYISMVWLVLATILIASFIGGILLLDALYKPI